MNEFVGKKCPYCNTMFEPDDNIVLCNTCEMPHHKDCWIENKGCTTFGCTGTIQGIQASQYIGCESDASSTGQGVYCTTCGTELDNNDAFCRKCGQRNVSGNSGTFQPALRYENANGTSYASSATSTTMNEEDKYVIQNVSYYSAKFSAIKTLNKKASWNWPAFFFAPYWCMYRKLYGPGLGILAFMFICRFLGQVSSLLSLTGSILFGCFANYIYLHNIQQLIIEEQALDENSKVQYIQNKGGVSVAACIITVVAYFILLTITMY